MNTVDILRKIEAKNDEKRSYLLRSAEDGKPADFDTVLSDLDSSIVDLKGIYDSLMAMAPEEAVEDAAPVMAERSKQVAPPLSVKNTAPAVHTKKWNYSLTRAINKHVDGRNLDGLEGETHQELSRFRSKAAEGFLIPIQRDLTTSTGTGAVGTNVLPDYIEYLYNNALGAKLGIQILTNMHGAFAYPRNSGINTGYWIAEGSATTASNLTFDQVVFTPRTCAAQTVFSRQFLKQASFDADKAATYEIQNALTLNVDASIFTGTGSSGQTLGLLNDTNVPTTAVGTNGGDPTWAILTGLETTVNAANASPDNRAYVLTPALNGKTKVTPKIGTTMPIYLQQDGKINDYPVFFSNQLPSNGTKGSGTNLSACVFGAWKDYMMVLYDNSIDVIVNPYSSSAKGGVEITALMTVDHQARHGGSFVKVTDFTTA